MLFQFLAETIIPLALENYIGVVLGSPLGGSLLAGPEPVIQEETPHDPGGNIVPALISGPTNPVMA